MHGAQSPRPMATGFANPNLGELSTSTSGVDARGLRDARASELTAVNQTIGYVIGPQDPFEYSVAEIGAWDALIRSHHAELLDARVGLFWLIRRHVGQVRPPWRPVATAGQFAGADTRSIPAEARDRGAGPGRLCRQLVARRPGRESMIRHSPPAAPATVSTDS